MIVLGIVGCICLFAMPTAVHVYDRIQLQSARVGLVNLYNSSRMSARASNRTTVLRVASNQIVVERNWPTGSAKDTLLITDVRDRYGVFLAGPDSVRIDSRGVLETSLPSPVKYVFSRGAESDSVQLSSYGRIVR